MNWLLIIIIVMLAGCVFEGYSKGLVKLAISMVMVLLTLVIVLVCTPVVGSFLKDHTGLYDYLNDKTSIYVEEQEIAEEMIEEEQDKVAEDIRMPKTVVELIRKNNTVEFYANLGVDTFNEYVSGYLAWLILDAIAFVVTSVVVMILFKILILATDIITKIPGIHGANKILGAGLGFIKGIVYIWFLFIIITMLINTEIGKQCSEMINSNELLLWIYNNNLLLKIITGAISSL